MGDRTAVIFDLDDTLYAERRFALSGFAAVAQRLAGATGHPADALFRTMVAALRRGDRATALQQLVSRFGLPEHVVEVAIDVIRTHPPRLRLPAASRDVLRQLRDEGHRIGVLTNGLPETQRGKVAALTVDRLVDAVVYAQEHAPLGKPAPACFAAVLSALDVVAGRAVFVGDHPDKDIAGARAAGLSTIWMVPAGRRLAPTTETIATSVREIPAVVRALLEPRHVSAS